MDFLFPLLKSSKSGVDDRGHRLRSGSPVTNLPGVAALVSVVNIRHTKNYKINLR